MALTPPPPPRPISFIQFPFGIYKCLWGLNPLPSPDSFSEDTVIRMGHGKKDMGSSCRELKSSELDSQSHMTLTKAQHDSLPRGDEDGSLLKIDYE